jgi:hypothetical protein
MIEIDGQWINPKRVAYLRGVFEEPNQTCICFSGQDGDFTTVNLPIKEVAYILNFDQRVGLIR